MKEDLAERLRSIVRTTDLIKYLEAIQKVNIPDGYLAAGVIRAFVWFDLFKNLKKIEVKDIDVPYFSDDLPVEKNQYFAEELEKICPTGKWECDNQKWVHLYEPKSDYWMPHAPYHSLEDSMKDWSFTVNTIAIRLNEKGKIEILHEENLEDLFNGVLRLTSVAKTDPRPYLEKYIDKIVTRYPDVRVIR